MSHPYVDEEPSVHFSPAELIERQVAEWRGLRTEVVAVTQREPFDYTFKSSQHLLIASERSERDDGETSVEGLPKSTLHSLSGKLTFVPAGHEFHGWQHPRVLTRASYFYIDPEGPLLDESIHFADIEFRPRLFFFDAELWRLTAKLRDEAKGGARLTHYGEALSVLLAHELVKLNDESAPRQKMARGGLSGWQQTRVADFIDAHLADDLRLSTLRRIDRPEPVSLCACVQTIIRPVAAPLSCRAAHRTCQDFAGRASPVDYRDRTGCRICGDQFILGGISQNDRTVAQRVSPRP